MISLKSVIFTVLLVAIPGCQTWAMDPNKIFTPEEEAQFQREQQAKAKAESENLAREYMIIAAPRPTQQQAAPSTNAAQGKKPEEKPSKDGPGKPISRYGLGMTQEQLSGADGKRAAEQRQAVGSVKLDKKAQKLLDEKNIRDAYAIMCTATTNNAPSQGAGLPADLQGLVFQYARELCESQVASIPGWNLTVAAYQAENDGPRKIVIDNKGAFNVFDSDTGKLVTTMAHEHELVYAHCLFHDDDGNVKAVFASSKLLSLWNLSHPDRNDVLTFNLPDYLNDISYLSVYDDHDEKNIVIGTNELVLLRNLATLVRNSTLRFSQPITCMTRSKQKEKNGRFNLYVAAMKPNLDQDSMATLHCYDMPSLTLVGKKTFNKAITALWCNDDSELIIGFVDGSLIVQTAETSIELKGHTDQITALKTLKMGDVPYIISTSFDGTMRIWDYEHTCVTVLKLDKKIKKMDACVDNQKLYTACAWFGAWNQGLNITKFAMGPGAFERYLAALPKKEKKKACVIQ